MQFAMVTTEAVSSSTRFVMCRLTMGIKNAKIKQNVYMLYNFRFPIGHEPKAFNTCTDVLRERLNEYISENRLNIDG